MKQLVPRCAVILLLPIVVLTGGSWVLLTISDRHIVDQQLHAAAMKGLIAERDRTPLSRRWLGYDALEAQTHWRALDASARDAERRFLEADLAFPVFYGGALATSLLLAWALLRRSFRLVWPFVGVAIGMIADWTENLVQLAQLSRFETTNRVDHAWVAVASGATILKIDVVIVAFVVIAVCVAVILWSGHMATHPRHAMRFAR